MPAAPRLSAAPTMPAAPTGPRRPSSASNYIIACVLAVAAWVATFTISAFVSALGYLLLFAGIIAIAGFAIGKLWSGAPAAVRNSTKWLRNAPVYVLAPLFVTPCGASLPLMGKAEQSKRCKNAEMAALHAVNDASYFKGSDPFRQLESLKSTIDDGRKDCSLADDEKRIAKLDELFATLERQAHSAACEPLAREALEAVEGIGDSLTPQEQLHAFTSSNAKVEHAIAVCNRGGATEDAATLTRVKAETVAPGIIRAQAAVEAAELAKIRAAIDAATLKVPIRTLLNEYSDNEIRADALYKGKLVQVTGRVSDTKRDILNSIYVTLGTGRMFEIPEVQCFFEDDWARAAAQLSKGQTITVRGRVDGLMFNVLMSNCEIVAW